VKTRAKKPSDKPTEPAFLYRLEGSVFVTCGNCGHSFPLSASLNEGRVFCPFCIVKRKIPGDVLDFFSKCENQQ